MNVHNVDRVISLMKKVDNMEKEMNKKVFSISHFLSAFFSHNNKELHEFEESDIVECGTTCCISGWMNFAKDFEDVPGKIKTSGPFIIEGHGDVSSVAVFLDIPIDYAEDLIFPKEEDYFQDDVCITKIANDSLIWSPTGVEYWKDITPEIVVKALENLKESYPNVKFEGNV